MIQDVYQDKRRGAFVSKACAVPQFNVWPKAPDCWYQTRVVLVDTQAPATGVFVFMEQIKRCSRGDKCLHPDGPLLPVNDFHKDKTEPDGHAHKCKACAKDNTAHWYSKYHDEICERRARKYSEHPEENREYRREHREEMKRSRKKYEVAHPEIYRAYHLNRKAREKRLPNTFTGQDWKRCLAYFGGRCAICGRQATYSADLFGRYILAADHWIPLSSADCPGTIPTNIVPLCHGFEGCNNSKHHRNPHKWLIEIYGQRKAKKIENRIRRYFDSLE